MIHSHNGERKNAGNALLESASFNESGTSMDMREFKMFRSLIHAKTGIWLRDGKEVMLASRLSRRLRHHRLSSFAEYYSYVETASDGGEEMGEFINCVTTNKTSFFREPHHFDFLADTVGAEMRLAVEQGVNRTFHIWSAACSTGEEPYSIAMSLLETLKAPGSPKNRQQPAALSILPERPTPMRNADLKIFASDIDTAVLNTAARGVYNEAALESVYPPMQKQYFLRGKGEMAGQVRVKQEVVRHIHFERINLMDKVWPIDGLFDAIFFRNALIYFKQETQNVFLRKIVRYLKPGGYLFLGHSENVPWLYDVVAPLKNTIYQLRAPSRS